MPDMAEWGANARGFRRQSIPIRKLFKHPL